MMNLVGRPVNSIRDGESLLGDKRTGGEIAPQVLQQNLLRKPLQPTLRNLLPTPPNDEAMAAQPAPQVPTVAVLIANPANTPLPAGIAPGTMRAAFSIAGNWPHVDANYPLGTTPHTRGVPQNPLSGRPNYPWNDP